MREREEALVVIIQLKQDHSLTLTQYAALASFRYELRRFLAFSESAAAAVGLPPQQHQALLAIAGHLGPQPPSVGTIAERLLIAPHTAAELVARMIDAALLIKTPSPADRRRMTLTLTENAERLLRELTAAHLNEFKTVEPVLTLALRRIRDAQILRGDQEIQSAE
jgi:DNA-binding MarR family transcriptional regulator